MLENKRKEYIQLSVAITRAKKAGKNITELLIQRQKLISERPNQTKSREQINRNYYRKNKEILQKQARSKKEEEKEREQERREQAVKVLATKLYEVNNIKVLMSFKAYTELSKEKKKLEEADNLIRDYRETATNKERSDER
ncbi:14835_t:CDS:2, partial [Racocetra fulgida]